MALAASRSAASAILLGGEQIVQHDRLQPVGTLLAPQAADRGGRRLLLVQVARAPGGEPQRLVLLELGRILVRQQEEGPAAQAVANAVAGPSAPCRRRWQGRWNGCRCGARLRIGRAKGRRAWRISGCGCGLDCRARRVLDQGFCAYHETAPPCGTTSSRAAVTEPLSANPPRRRSSRPCSRPGTSCAAPAGRACRRRS